MKPSPQELNALIASSARDRYIYFIKRVVDFEEVWGLYNDGWAMVTDEDGQSAMVLWPAQAYAEHSKGEDWQDFTVKSMSLDELIDVRLPWLTENDILVAVFLVPQHEDNMLVPPGDLLLDLREELRKYE